MVRLLRAAVPAVGAVSGRELNRRVLGRLRKPIMGIAAGLTVALVATGCLAANIAPAVLLVTVGVAIGGIVGPVVALPAAVLQPQHRALGMGVFWAMYFLLLALLPPLAGLARDLTGSAGAPLYAAAVYLGLGLVALVAYLGGSVVAGINSLGATTPTHPTSFDADGDRVS